jgi:hypothetical protein
MQAESSAPARRIEWGRLLRRYGTLIGFLAIIGLLSWQKPDTFMTIPN